LRISLATAVKAHARHFVFVGVAHPAPAMKALDIQSIRLQNPAE
jgi:hypothetical protein